MKNVAKTAAFDIWDLTNGLCYHMQLSAGHAGYVSQTSLLVIRKGTHTSLGFDIKGQFRPGKPTMLVYLNPRVDIRTHIQWNIHIINTGCARMQPHVVLFKCISTCELMLTLYTNVGTPSLNGPLHIYWKPSVCKSLRMPGYGTEEYMCMHYKYISSSLKSCVNNAKSTHQVHHSKGQT